MVCDFKNVKFCSASKNQKCKWFYSDKNYRVSTFVPSKCLPSTCKFKLIVKVQLSISLQFNNFKLDFSVNMCIYTIILFSDREDVLIVFQFWARKPLQVYFH